MYAPRCVSAERFRRLNTTCVFPRSSWFPRLALRMKSAFVARRRVEDFVSHGAESTRYGLAAPAPIGFRPYGKLLLCLTNGVRRCSRPGGTVAEKLPTIPGPAVPCRFQDSLPAGTRLPAVGNSRKVLANGRGGLDSRSEPDVPKSKTPEVAQTLCQVCNRSGKTNASGNPGRE